MPSRLARVLVPTIVVAVLSSLTGTPARAGEPPEAARILDRMVAFLGGPEAVYGVRTLVVSASARRDGEALAVPTRTTFAFPLHVRRDFVVAGRTLALVSGPDGAQLVTRDGGVRLSASERVAFERSTMRDPVALAKARLGRGVSVELAGTDTVDGAPTDLVRLRQGGHETVLAVARDDGRLVAIRYPLDAQATMTVRFGGWAVRGRGLRYPAHARGTIDGRDAFAIEVQGIDVDPPLDPVLFAVDEGVATFSTRAGEGLR